MSFQQCPQEAWLEEQVYVRHPDVHVFSYEGQSIGYCCVDQSKGLLLQFCIAERFSRFAVESFEKMLGEFQIKLAYVTTRDPLALSLALTFQKKVTLESYLFVHAFDTDIPLVDFTDPDFRKAQAADAAAVRETSGDFFGDVDSEITGGKLFVLKAANDLLGIGYLSGQYCNEGSTNLGMFTNPKFRRRNIGSYILQKLVGISRENRLAPIAACYHSNIESKRTLEKAGFVSRDRMFIVSFQKK